MDHSESVDIIDLAQTSSGADSTSSLSQYGTVICLAIIFIYFFKKYMAGPYFDSQGFDLTGKYAVVTGGNSGIGKQTVLELVRLNCNVIIGARDKKNSQQVVKVAEKIIASKQYKSNIIVEHYYLDLGSKQSIKEFSDLVYKRIPKIDYLVNNAGLSMIPEHRKTADGFEMHYGVNYLGHFFLTYLLMDLIKKSDFFRIINVSSMAHKRLLGFGPIITIDWQNLNFTAQNSYEQNLAYSRSKLCNVLFTKGLAERIPSTKGICASLHPGVVKTQILRHRPIYKVLILIFYPLFWLFTKNSWQGAQTTLYTLLDKSIESGEYYADNQKSTVNQFALQKSNVEKLWEVSEKYLGIKFDIRM